MKKKILGVFVTLLFLGFILYKIDFSEVIDTIKLFRPSRLMYIAICYIIPLILRGFRWKLFLGNDKKYSGIELAEIFTIGTMFNILLPARAGDIYRAYRLGGQKSEKKMKIFGSVILERIFDGAAIFFILLFAVKTYFSQSYIVNLTAAAAGIVFIGSLFLAFAVFGGQRINKLLAFTAKSQNKFLSKLLEHKLSAGLKAHISSFAEGFILLNNIKALLLAFGFSIAIWILECVTAYLIINSFGIIFPLSASLFVLSLTTFSTMIPSTSIFLGPFQAAYILALSIYGADREFSLAVSVIHNIILTFIVCVLGCICLLKNSKKYFK